MEFTRKRDWRLAQKQRNKSRDIHTALLRFRGEKTGRCCTRAPIRSSVRHNRESSIHASQSSNWLRVVLQSISLPMNVLFICSRNQWRSPTAEQVFRRYSSLSVRSAGTSRNARKTVSADLLHWADVICVMEQKHKNRLVADFRRILENKPLHVLDIPDDFHFMDPALVTLLEETVPDILEISG